MRLPRFLNRGMDVVDDRTGLITATKGAMYHRVPRNAKWWYVFGSATLMFFIIQLLTGVLLATLYVPSAAEAYSSLVYIDEKVPGVDAPCPSRLEFERDVRHDVDPHGAGVSARDLQVSA